jgi:hypothetical protein
MGPYLCRRGLGSDRESGWYLLYDDWPPQTRIECACPSVCHHRWHTDRKWKRGSSCAPEIVWYGKSPYHGSWYAATSAALHPSLPPTLTTVVQDYAEPETAWTHRHAAPDVPRVIEILDHVDYPRESEPNGDPTTCYRQPCPEHGALLDNQEPHPTGLLSVDCWCSQPMYPAAATHRICAYPLEWDRRAYSRTGEVHNVSKWELCPESDISARPVVHREDERDDDRTTRGRNKKQKTPKKKKRKTNKRQRKD